MNTEVTVFADLCVDVLIRGNVSPQYDQVEQVVDDYEVELGGSAAIFAAQFVKLGGGANLLGIVGNDFFGEYLIRRVNELGINAQIEKKHELKTSLGLGLIRNTDRAMLTYSGSMIGMTVERVRCCDFFHQAQHVHIASYFLLKNIRSSWPELIGQLATGDCTFSLDTNWSPENKWDDVKNLLDKIDVFLPNKEEALRISGKETIREAGTWLSQFGCLVVIKCGSDGAVVFDGKKEMSFAVPNELLNGLEIIDTTGAGDNFDAGFLYQWLKGAPLKQCIELALRCGTKSLSRTGGIAGQVVHSIEQLKD